MSVLSEVPLKSNKDYFVGLPLEYAKAFMKAGMPYAARAFGILWENGLLRGIFMLRYDIANILEPIMEKHGARCFFQEIDGKPLMGYTGKDKAKKYKEVLRKRHDDFLISYSELVSEFTADVRENMVVISDTNSKRGPKPKETMFLPTKEQLGNILVDCGAMNMSETMTQSFSKFRMEAFKSSAAYKRLLLTDHVEALGDGFYSRYEIAKTIGCSEKTVRNNAEKMGQKVTPQPVGKEKMTEAMIKGLPETKAERKRLVKEGLLWEGLHIRDGFGYSYSYSKEGVEKLRARNPKGSIWKCWYTKSHYEPAGDRVYYIQSRLDFHSGFADMIKRRRIQIARGG